MFTRRALTLIKEWATKDKHHAQIQLDRLHKQPNPSGFVLLRVLHYNTKIQETDKILAEVQEQLSVQRRHNFASLDASHQIDLLSLCRDLNSEWQNFPELYFEGDEVQDVMYRFYLLGNIEGRIVSDHVTPDDLEMLELWEEEMEGV